MTLYDRIERLVTRFVPKPLISPPPSPLRAPASLPDPEKTFFHSPVFRLSVSDDKEAHFNLDWPPKTFDVLDRYRFLHVGYALSEDMAWLFIICLDGIAEGHSIKAVATPRSPGGKKGAAVDLAGLVSSVWSVAKQIVDSTSVEWRITIGKLGSMETRECRGMPFELPHIDKY
jgi:mediator of RNA polymerase II transcription subunit 13